MGIIRGKCWAFFVLCLIAAFAFAGCAGTGEKQKESQYPKAPPASFEDIDGNSGSLADYLGNSVVLVNFWGLRCQNCIEEMPFLERLHNKYGGKGLVVLGINTDGIDGALLKEFLPQLPVEVSYSLIIDPEFVLADTFEMTAAPLTIIVARDGTVRFKHEGYEPAIESTYVELIEKLLVE